MSTLYYESSFAHHGIKGQKWGVRRFQNPDGTLTKAGRDRNWDSKRYVRDKYVPMVTTNQRTNRNRLSLEKRTVYTRSGKKHVQSALNNAKDNLSKYDALVDDVKRTIDAYNDTIKPIKDFANNKALSKKYIDKAISKFGDHGDYDYEFYEYEHSIKSSHNPEAAPFKMYAKDYGIDYRKLSKERSSAFKKVMDATDKYTDAILSDYGDTTIDRIPVSDNKNGFSYTNWHLTNLAFDELNKKAPW